MPTIHLQRPNGVNVGPGDVDDAAEVDRAIIDEGIRTVVVEVDDDGEPDCRECATRSVCRHERGVASLLETVEA